MEDQRITTEMAAAMNQAQDGRIIADSEEPVRDAHGKFRQQAYAKVISLLQQQQEAFSPSTQSPTKQGKTSPDTHDCQWPDHD